MLKYEELTKGKTKVLLPNGCTGVVTDISPIKTMKGGLLRGRDKVKVAYTTKTGNTEAWFQLGQLRTYKLVPVKVNTDIQPVPQGKESWKSENTFNGVEVVKGVGMTKDEIVPDGVMVEDNKPSINDLFKVKTSTGEVRVGYIDEEASDRVEQLMKDNIQTIEEIKGDNEKSN